ncbi:phosphoprotein [avian paramyxovirus 14]|uniref:Phosphoprotein n=1 Tax=avian paramyxovirus 14 TaxID=1928005 RepID=A0A1L5YIL7_9MONO|nr:phosphoprotein [Avian paramyxovirus 14]APP90889.1 phosphoprotein [Avian paramyxovirus 14]
MDFSDDNEITELLNISLDTINKIQHAEDIKPKTVGKSAIKPGNTKALTKAWEDDSNTTSDNTQNDVRGNSSAASNAQQSKEESGPETRPETAGVEVPSDPTKSSPDQAETGWSRGSNLDKTLENLEKATSNRVSDQTQKVLKGAGGQGPTPQETKMNNGRKAQKTTSGPAVNIRTQPNAGLDSGRQDIGENTQLIGANQASGFESGAIPNVLQSPQYPGSSHVSAVNAQEFANFASTITETLRFLVARVETVENRLTELTKLIMPIMSIKNDINSIKTSCSLLEGQMAMVQILEPGSAHYSSLNELRQATQKRVLVSTEQLHPKQEIFSEGVIVKDEVGRPVSANTRLGGKNTAADMTPVTTGEIEALNSMLDSFGITGKKRARLESQINSIKTSEDAKRVKRMIMAS